MERYSCKHWVQLLFDSGSSSPGAVFVFSSGSGPGGSGMWHANRDKHWVQLQFDSRSFSPGAVFIPSGSGPGGTNRQILWLGMWIPSYLGFADCIFLCLRFCSSHILPRRKKACRVDNIGVWGLLNLSSGGAQRAQKQQQRILFLP